jgi:NADH-quinone oxidoreductase subunit L
MVIGAISSAGIPGFAGFFSKDAIIEAVDLSRLPGAGFAHFAVLCTVFVTALYTFRLLFMTFHGTARFHASDDGDGHASTHAHGAHDTPASREQGSRLRDATGRESGAALSGAGVASTSGVTSPEGAPVPPSGGAPHESPAVVTVPLVLLAIPSVCAGWLIGPVLFGGYFGNAIVVAPAHDVLGELAREFHGVFGMMTHALASLPFWFAVAGIATATYFYLLRPDLTDVIRKKAGMLHTILDRKYGFDEAYQLLFGNGAVRVGTGLWKGGDVAVIDGFFVNGSARFVGWFATVIRHFQSGFIYHYAFTMIIGVLMLLTMIFIF